MRLGFLAAELAPHVQVGGLGDVARWLPRALAAGGDEVAVFLPAYDVLDPKSLAIRPVAGVGDLDLGPLGTARVSTLGDPGPREPTVYLIDAPQWFRAGAAYPGDEDHLRFAALAAAVPALGIALGWVPDLVHANDWHTGLAALYLARSGEPWSSLPVVFTVHNLAYQGIFPASDLPRLGLEGLAGRFDTGDLAAGWLNCLKTGIATATVVTTVSPSFAREMMTPEAGMGLDTVLAARGDLPVGILNGIGDDWDPLTDPHLPYRYEVGDLEGKAVSTRALRQRLGLRERPGVPILGVISRMDRQKGFDLLRETMPPLLARNRVQLAALGTGDPAIESMFAAFARRFPAEVAYAPVFDTTLAHLIEAGSDMFLMPSVFEPSGLNQMYSMRYGTPPIAHRTGGLADSIEPWNGAEGTGFLFTPHTPEAFAATLEEALAAFEDREGWRRLVANGMRRDFSWATRAAEYRVVY
ncbi:MAG: glycogen synthase, partial [Acidimicrobiia bacterium]|nr:glycogen synthase [Acidimicrobiia bacterium]